MTPDRFQYDLFRVLAPLSVLALLVLLVSSLGPERRKRPAALTYSFFVAVTILYILANTLEVCSTTQDSGLLWSRMIYVFVGILPLIWLDFCLRFTREGRGLAKPLFALVLLIPVATVFIVFSPALMGLVWPSISWVEQGGFLVSVRSHGPWFVVYATYTYLFALGGAFVAIRAFVRYRSYYRRQAAFVTAGIAFPLVASLLFVLRPFPGLIKDYTPLSYALSCALFYLALFKRDLFALAPIARSLVIERMRDGLLVVDGKGFIVDGNPRGLKLLGLSESCLGKPLLSVAGRAIDAEGRDILGFVLDGPRREFRLIEEGRESWYSAEVVELGGRAGGRLLTLHDETQTKMLLQRVSELASTDELTGLPNRRCFMREAGKELSRAERHGSSLAVAMFDLDHFKDVNDTWGHATGDAALQEFGRIVREEMRAGDFAGRLGGEEFGLLLVEADDAGARSFCERIRSRLEACEVYNAEGAQVRVTASAGYVVFEAGRTDIDALLSLADRALYRAKQLGRNRIVSYAT